MPDGSKPQKHDLNPEHLFEGTPTENAHDTVKYRKNRILSDENVNFIREKLNNIIFKSGDATKFDQEMAIVFGVANTTIQSVRLGRTFNPEKKEVKMEGTLCKKIVQLSLIGKYINKYKGSKTIRF